MPGVSADQVKLAREVDLLSYLQANEPHELLPPKNGEYRTVTHGSLVISKGKWIWNRGKFGGMSALDFLIKMRGMGFVEAVETVLGLSAGRTPISFALPVEVPKPYSVEASEQALQKEPIQKSAQEPKNWTFYPPKPQRYPSRAVSYLQRRGISPAVINRALRLGILYESRYYNLQSEYHNAAVCVFAGKDDSGKVAFAALRGIDTDFKQDKAGSDKRFNFCIPAQNPDSRHLAVFEAPIDALSHATLQQRSMIVQSRNDERSGDGSADGSVGGLVASSACCSTMQPAWQWDGYRLSLGGTTPVALISFLERNPQISRIMLHLDNDTAGLTAASKIKAQLAADSRFKHIRVSVNPPRGAKDYNDALRRVILAEQEQKQSRRREAAILL